MNDELRSLVEHPTAGNYRRLRARLLAERDGDETCSVASLADLNALTRACVAGHWKTADRLLVRMWTPWVLSPRLHYWAACIAETRGDADDAELERCLFTTCLDSLLATGNGSERQPYLVTYLSDVGDLLAARKLRAIERRLIEKDGGWRDVVRCRGDRQVWCDVTDLVASAGRTICEEAARDVGHVFNVPGNLLAR